MLSFFSDLLFTISLFSIIRCFTCFNYRIFVGIATILFFFVFSMISLLLFLLCTLVFLRLCKHKTTQTSLNGITVGMLMLSFSCISCTTLLCSYWGINPYGLGEACTFLPIPVTFIWSPFSYGTISTKFSHWNHFLLLRPKHMEILFIPLSGSTLRCQHQQKIVLHHRETFMVVKL